jgi:phosphoglycolate/pyridoxal phosphate phosphatase family enzyme
VHTVAQRMAWLAEIDTVMLDCDGVLWRGSAAIEGAAEAITALRRAGKRVVFVTNNSTKSRASYVHKVEETLGVKAAEEEILCSAHATAAYLQRRGVRGRVYVVGERGLCEELRAVGLETLGEEDGRIPFEASRFREEVDVPKDVVAVVVGLDTEVSYRKVAIAACLARRGPGVVFVATNKDVTFPGKDDLVLPGAGSVVAMVEAAAMRTVDATLGKPAQDMLDLADEAMTLDRSRTLMVGDRLDTDIAFGRRGGLRTLLVLTGVTSRAVAEALPKDEAPDHVLESIADILPLLA